jgi:hypothetical protein
MKALSKLTESVKGLRKQSERAFLCFTLKRAIRREA